ncbi:MAG: hypothetical protein M3023_07785 [Pseudomonadota bacterium]|nr:hypothetical protein [Pseudomonadota bacterium]
MLLHLLVIVLIGDATRSGARRGESFWGSLDVSLRRPSPEPGAGVKLAPGAETSSPGAVALRRPQGATDAPTAARNEPKPAIERPAISERDQIDRAPADALPPPREAESLPPAPRPFEVVPPVNLDAPQEVDKAPAPSAVPPPNIERQPSPAVERAPRVVPIAPPPLERVAPRKIERELAPSVELIPREAPVPPAPLERIVPQQTERALSPPVELTPRELPMTPANIEPSAPARIERELAPAIEIAPREQPIAPPALERVAPARIERELATPPAVAPHEVPAAPAPIERIAPPPQSRELISPSGVPRSAEPSAPAQRTVPSMEREAVPRAPASRPATPSEAAPAESPPGESPPRLRFGTPRPDDEMFKPRNDVVVPSAEPGGAPRIDREALRARVREIAREGAGSRALVQVELPEPVRPPKNPFDQAVKPDCRTAYAGLGLLAIPVLVASAIADSGCKW